MTDAFPVVTRARRTLEGAEARLRHEIVRAYHSRGDRTVDDLAKSAGFTRQRIYQLVKEAKDRA